MNQTAAKRLYTYISFGAVPSLTGGYYNCAEDKISRKRKSGGKYTSFGPTKNTTAIGGCEVTPSSSSPVRRKLRGRRRRKEDINIAGGSTCANFKPNPIIASKQMVVVTVEGDEQTEEYLQHHQQEGGQGGSRKEVECIGQKQLPAVGRKAEPWKAKARRRGVKKDSLVQSRLENFVKLYPNLSIRGGLVKKCESEDGVSGGVGRGVKRGIMEVELETGRLENNSFGGENTS